MFLAAADLLVMVTNLLLHFIPQYYRTVPIFYTDLGCGIGNFSQAVSTTVSAWYLVLMTVERFIVVWFPIKVRI